MHCCVMGFLKYLAICVIPFLALHKISRMKANTDLISASLGNKGFMDYEEIFSPSYLAECCDISSYFAVFYSFVSLSLYVLIKKFNNL